ncbi:MAG: 3-methyl-2-oxobutanoate hydroxymethyltransferase [Candidatus Margulisiibacteriota bacterium]|nr:3-methyl-2-oxobutanoate hydroxymethyltransferase [Candidatus Margulisiibacteriota bacterium]
MKPRKISMLTAYDYPFAKILDEAGVDIILVGDSLGNVVLGYKDTRSVTMDDMVHHTKAVARGVERALVVADIPYRSVSVRNAKLLIKAGAKAVKVEGIKGVKRIVKAGIPVMGHLGYLPQTMRKPKIKRSASVIKQAKELEAAGVFAIVLEMVDPKIAKEVTKTVNAPTIGIGSGRDCDGQVLVTYDILGLTDWAPSFAKRNVDLKKAAGSAIREFIKDLRP